MFERKKIARLVLLTTTLAIAAEESAGGIAGIVGNVNTALESLITLFSQISFFAGFLFVVFGIWKFKQHKDNPTQITVGTPITMVAIGTALMFVGNFISPLGETLFGSEPSAGVNAKEITSGLKSKSS